MPRGDNPNSRANLICPKRDLTAEEQRQRASKAGKASAKARKEYASLTEALKDQCTPEVKAKIMSTLIRKAEAGNLKAIEMLRDQLGEKPVEQIRVTQVEETTIDDMKRAIGERKNGGAD